MLWNDWLSIVAIVFSIIAFMFSWKWSSDSERTLAEIRRVSDEIKISVEERTKEIERRVEERTKEIEQQVDNRTKDMENLLDRKTDVIANTIENRVADLVKRAAPTDEDKAWGNVLNQVGPQLIMSVLSNPEMMKEIVKSSKD